jgi:leucyl aminopeptidase
MPTQYNVKEKNSVLPRTELVVLFWKKDNLGLVGKDKAFVQQMLTKFSATGETNETQIIQYPVNDKLRSVFCFGLGDRPAIDTFRRGVAAAVQFAKTIAVREITVIVPEIFKEGFETGVAAVEGVELGGYQFAKYQTQQIKINDQRSILSVDFLVGKGMAVSTTRGIKTGKIYCDATILARNLVNEPAKNSRPTDLVTIAQQIADVSKGSVKVEIFDQKECELRKMGAFLAVAQGSTHEPYFIHLVYQPEKKTESEELVKIALVGKGVTFDSGGLSIKPSDSMETMKCDMAGAAAVLGVFSVLEKTKPQAIVHGYIAACENMPSGSAIKPGDVIETQSGKTVEIRNTDAEGRLTLADSISEALKEKPDYLIDIATLTGACVVALGEEVSGLFSNDQELAEQLMIAAQKEGEQVWPMPLIDDYRSLIKSAIADIRNTSLKRWGGAITAALFLEAFVEKTPWIHLDIAGPAYSEQQVNPVNPVGASGSATRLLLRFLRDLKRVGAIHELPNK